MRYMYKGATITICDFAVRVDYKNEVRYFDTTNSAEDYIDFITED